MKEWTNRTNDMDLTHFILGLILIKSDLIKENLVILYKMLHKATMNSLSAEDDT